MPPILLFALVAAGVGAYFLGKKSVPVDSLDQQRSREAQERQADQEPSEPVQSPIQPPPVIMPPGMTVMGQTLPSAVVPTNVKGDKGDADHTSGAGEYDDNWVYVYDVRSSEYDILWLDRRNLWVWGYMSRNNEAVAYNARLADFLSKKRVSDDVILGDPRIVLVRTTDPKIVNPMADGQYVLGMGTKGLLRFQCGSKGPQSNSKYLTSVVYIPEKYVVDVMAYRQSGVEAIGGLLQDLIQAMPSYANKSLYAYAL